MFLSRGDSATNVLACAPPCISRYSSLIYIYYVRCKHKNHHIKGIHVIDVTQSTHALIEAGGLRAFMSNEDVFTVTLAAIIHDYEHRGFSNDFLMKTKDKWATVAAEVSDIIIPTLPLRCSFWGFF